MREAVPDGTRERKAKAETGLSTVQREFACVVVPPSGAGCPGYIEPPGLSVHVLAPRGLV